MSFTFNNIIIYYAAGLLKDIRKINIKYPVYLMIYTFPNPVAYKVQKSKCFGRNKKKLLIPVVIILDLKITPLSHQYILNSKLF